MAEPITRREILRAAGVAPLLSPRSGGAPAPVRSPADRRRELYGLLGDLPSRRRAISGRKLGEDTRDHYVLERWELDLNGVEPVPAVVARPLRLTGRVPAVVFNHSHGGGYTIGKKEFTDGRSYLQPRPYAEELARLGYIALAIDHWVFGERSHTTEGDMFKAMLWQGQVLWGMMVYDSLRAVDWLVARDDVDRGRLATLGISMGSTMAWWLAALDERIKVTVDICCLTDFHTLLAKKDLSAHGVYYYVPRLLKHFTTAQINALIAPRAHLALAGLKDKLTPVEGLDLIDAELQKVYAAAGRADHWLLKRYDVGHQETAAGRQEVVRFLERHL
jgi:dienelactone hydrolase